ncbi:MAG: methyltransferase domain-containing protein [Clostridium sp.]|nr:methyltransferase domain-containing protein [Clostridium sp.]
MNRKLMRPGGEELTDRLFGLAGIPAGPLTLLDVGCGSGYIMEYLAEKHPDWKISGIDPDPWEGCRLPVRKACAEHIPVEDGSVDIVLMECSLSRFEDPAAALREARRILRPEGHLLISDMYSRLPEKDAALAEIEIPAGSWMGKLYSADTVRHLLEEAGFLPAAMEDCSDTLGNWVAQTIMDGGTEALRDCTGMDLRTLRGVKCGYFLCAAAISPLWDTLRYAAAHSPFFQGKNLEKVRTMEEFRKLPFCSAEDIRERPEAFLCVQPKEVARIITLGTSGTAGKPKRLFFTEKDLLRTADFFERGIRYLTEPGWSLTVYMEGPGRFTVGGLLLEGLSRIPEHVLVHGLIRDMDRAAEDGRDADAFVGIPGQMYALSETHPELRPKSVLLSGDYVPESVKKHLEDTWHCRVFTHWGMTETGYGGGVQCGAREGCHLRVGDLMLEVIDPETGENVPEGEYGELVLTTFHREAMPLIRYRTGDMGRLIPGKCGCGSLLPRLGKVQGRFRDEIRLGDGRMLTVHLLDETILGMKGVQDYRAVWDPGTACLSLTIMPVSGHNFKKPDVEKRLGEVFGRSFRTVIRTGSVDCFRGSAKRSIELKRGE